MPDWLANVPAWASFGVGAGGGFVAFKFLLEWLAGRMDKQREGIDAGTQRLIAGLEKRLEAVTVRLDDVEKELADCKRRHAESEAEVLRLKAIMRGMGDARQHAQLIVSSEKKEAKG